MPLVNKGLLLALILMLIGSCSSTSASAGLTTFPSSVNFGSVTVNGTGSATVTLKNGGRQSITILQASASLPEFTVTGPLLPATVAAGNSATFQVTFRPDSAKVFSGSLSFTLNRTSGGTKTVTVQGTGLAATTPQIGVTPGSENFTTNVGGTQSQSVTITSKGTSTLTVTQANLSGTGFSISGLTLPLSLSPGQSKMFSVKFAPAAPGSFTGAVSLVSNTANSPTKVALAGTATQTVAVTGVTISPTNATVQTGQTVQFSDSVQGTSTNTAVTWTASAGTITSNGLFTAPSTAGTVTVKAISNADATKYASANVTVSAPTSSAPSGPQFYVATTGNNSNSGTSPSAPWRTIQYAMSNATPGSTVNILGGTYHEKLIMDVSGTAGNYITFQPYNFSVPTGGCGGYTGITCGGDQVILDYGFLGTNTSTTPFFLISAKSYIRVQGLTFQNFTCTGAMQQGLRIDNGSSYVEFDYNKFLNLKNVYPSRDGTAALLAIRVWSPSNNITFTGNELGTIWTNMSEALTFDGSSASKGLVQDNYIHDTDQLGATTYNGANNITFRHNKLEYISVQRNGTVWFNNPSTALYADSGYSIVMERNFINHAGVGFEALSEPGQAATHDITIRDNVVENSYSSGIVIGTWYSSTDGSSVYNINVWNNTFYQNTPNVTIRPMVSSTVAWQNNIFYGSSNYANSLNWNPGNAAFNLYFAGNSGPGSNNLTSDPLFVSPATGNFSLQSTSPAINAGDPTSSTTMVGTLDFAGHTRMVNGQIDIGAYEVQ